MKKIKDFILNNETNASIVFLSFLALVSGSLAIGFIKSFIFIALINIIVFLIIFINENKHILKKGDLMKKINIKKLKFTNKSKSNISKTKNNNKNVKINKNKTNKKKNNPTKRKVLKTLLLICITFVIIGIIVTSSFLYIVIKDAPEFDTAKLYNKEASIIYDSKGEIITKIGTEMREKVSFDELPQVLVDAIIATEDARFFQHSGFDLPRFIKASFGQLLGNSDAGGASTLTMQISKNQFSSNEREGFEGIKRKFTDIYMAIFKIEKKYTKEEILEFYVNTYNMGAGAYGVEQACQTYFGKSVSEINLAEAAMIAGLYQAPNAYNPFRYPEKAEARRQTVLYLMKRHGYINNDEYQIAKKMNVKNLIKPEEDYAVELVSEYQAFIDFVVREVENITGYNPYQVSMEIYTTMDKDKQIHVNKVMDGKDSSFAWENEVVKGGVAVIDVNNGSVVALGGVKDKNSVNSLSYATGIKRQIGSTAKPLFDYGPGIEYNNWSTYTTFIDEPHAYTNGPSIKNWNNKYNGVMTMREALKLSMNIPALKAFQNVKNSDIKKFVTDLGLSPEIQGNMIHESHSLGGYTGESPLTLSAAYAAIANGGYYIEPYSVSKILYRETGEVYEHIPKKTRVMGEDTAYMLTDMLITSAKYNFSRYNLSGVTFGLKTGTTNFDDKTFQIYKYPSNAVNDLWAAAISPNYSIATWYGYENLVKEYYNKMGSGQNSKMLYAVAKGVFEKGTTFKKPDNVVAVKVEKENPTAMLPSEHTPSNMIITELFKKGTEPTEVSERYSQLSNVTNLDYKINGNKITLSWNPIATPKAIDKQYLSSYFKSIYKSENDANRYLDERINYNNQNIGTIIYNVYTKNQDGTLTFVSSTDKNSIEQQISTTAKPITYVVKTSYTIFKNNISSGAEITAEFDSNATIVTINLNGNSTVDLRIGDTYVEPNPAVIVMDNLSVVTDKATISKKITKKSTNQTIPNIDTTVADTYIITYTVTYSGYVETLTRTITIK
ncbi:MAG TPA: hypothetical protein GX747_04990 [Tenericutes bacterium]|nr:hypothetical protein [Mycoplasmatota bacterium]